MSIATKIERWLCRILRVPTCEELEADYYGYLAQALDPRSRLKMERHLKLCRRCRQFFDSYRKMVRMVGSMPLPSVEASFQKRMMEAVFVKLKP